MKLLLFIVYLITILNIVSSSSDDSAYGLWNQDENTAVIGIVDLTKSTVSAKYSFAGYQHLGRLNSDYNQVIGVIELVLLDLSTGIPNLVSFNVKTMKPNTPFFSDFYKGAFNITGITSSQSKYSFDLNVFYNEQGVNWGFLASTVDLPTDRWEQNGGGDGVFSSSYYSPNDAGMLVFLWTNFTTGAPYATLKDIGQIIKHDYEVTNFNYQDSTLVGQTPYNLKYVQGTNQAIGHINVLDKSTNTQYAQLFVVNYPPVKTIENLSINNPSNGLLNSNCITGTSGSTVYGVYQSNKYSTGFALIKWDLSNPSDPLISSTSFPVDLYNMFYIN